MDNRLSILLAAALASMVPATANAQTGGSMLWLVPPAGRLEVDSEQTGTLSSSDYYGPSDIYIDVWEIQGRAGAAVTIDVQSDDFDAVLFVVGPGMAETVWDDDSGGNCDARATIRFLEDGIYRVAATTNSSRTTGIYTLIVATDPAPPSAVPCGGPDPAEFDQVPVAGQITADSTARTGMLDAGDMVLGDDSHAEAWEIEGQAGQTVTILLESDAFDAYLYVTGPGLDAMVTDDDSGGDLDSQIVLTFPAAGVFRVIVSSVEPGGTGAYRLTVSM
jgi:hypothetical protein